MPRLLCSLTVLSLVLAACGQGVLTERFTGRLEGSDAMIAVVIDHPRVVAYTCGGPTTVSTHTRWFTGELAPDHSIRLEQDGVRLIGRWDEDRISGNIDGEAFEARSRHSTAETGLYEARRDGCRVGVIVHADAGEVVVQGAACDEQVDPQGPVRTDGFMVHVGEARVFVEPVVLE